MKPSVLAAAPPVIGQTIHEALHPSFRVLRCSDAARARALAALGWFEVVIAAGSLVSRAEVEPAAAFVAIGARVDGELLRGQVNRALAEKRRRDGERAALLVDLAGFTYGELLDLARTHAARQYLLGLVFAHRGSVTEAARVAGLERESLHRLLRRHGIQADRFRASE